MDCVQKIYLEKLFSLQDLKYRDFCINLTPSVCPQKIIGVRTPILRRIAAEIHKNGDAEKYLSSLPHQYYEENNLHAFLIEKISDFDRAIKELERFLPFVDNWATCDTMNPKVFSKNKNQLIPHIDRWINSSDTYAVRYAIKLLMQHFLNEEYSAEYAQRVVDVCSKEYYINMMRAWYFATALAKQYDKILPIIKEKRLDRWTHNKSIQKAIESHRITKEQKDLLKKLKY